MPERREPFCIDDLHRYRLRYEVVPPPGYRCAELPEDVDERIGPVSLRLDYEASESGTVTADYLLDTGSGRLNPEEAAELRSAVERLLATDEAGTEGTILTFKHAGFQHLEEGRFREALDECRKLALAHPENGTVQSHLAAVLNDTGFGEAARRVARRGVELDENSSYTHLVLGSVLTFDLFGRQYARGFDRAAALAALQKAVELDPNNLEARLRLGNLLERDLLGYRFGREADFEGAAEQYRKLAEVHEGRVPGLDESRMYIHWFSRDHAAARKYAEGLVDGPIRNAIILAATAVSESAEVAIGKSAGLESMFQQRKQVLLHATDLLNAMRHYSQSAALLRHAGELGWAPPHWKEWCHLRDRLRRHEEIAFDDDDPRRVVQKLFVSLLQAPRHSANLAPLLAKSPQDGNRSFTNLVLLDRLFAQSRQNAMAMGTPNDWRADLASLLDYEVEGSDATGYRIVAKPGWQIDTTWYVVKRKDGYRLLDPGDNRGRLGSMALSRLVANDVDGAHRLLGWAMRDRNVKTQWTNMFNPYAYPAFVHLWYRKKEVEPIRLGAAALAYRTDRAIEILEKAREGASDTERLQIDRALAGGYLHSKQYEKALETAEHLIAKHPRAAEPYDFKVAALDGMGELDRLQQTLDASPEAPSILDTQAALAMLRGEYNEAIDVWQKVARSSGESPITLCRLAWCQFASGTSIDAALRNAVKASEVPIDVEGVAFFVLAAIRAEHGDIAGAREALARHLNVGNTDEAPNGEWYIVGRLAEQCGLHEVAVASYQKVPQGSEFWPRLVYRRTQERLSQLAE